MRYSSKLLVTASILLIGLAAGKSAYAETKSIFVTGNGSSSVNNASAVQSQSTFVTQTNSSTVINTISVSADTGNNAANNNTKGDSSISTGSIASGVLVNNAAGTNSSSSCCAGTADPLTVLVSGNGAYSSNEVSSSYNNTNVVKQTNSTNLLNKVEGDLNTGGNSTSGNTNGASRISTDNIFSSVSISNTLNSNVANLLCCNAAKVTPNGPPIGGSPSPTVPVAAILQTPGQVLAASKSSVLPMTGADDTMWIMSLASLVLLFGFVVRKYSASLLMGTLGA